MSAYNPPVDDMITLLYDVFGFTHDTLDRETAGAILDEAAKLARDILAPLNKVGDQTASRLEGDEVITPPGFKDAYAQYRDAGWNSVPFSEEFGGQDLPWALAFCIQEMWQGANMSFGLCPLLNQGAVEAILSHGTDAQKEFYLSKLISGEWTGTMNLTEPQAGSDLGLLRAKAEPQDDGSYKISGQKIYITYGEHDFTENIIHLVLARLPDAPEDVKGISLFIVPKFLEDGARNTVKCIGLEHKLGIHASPTCTMEFDGATGYLLGQENEGLKCMFTMMNNARLSVGLQGVAVAEAAYQHALAYARDRVQGKDLKTGERVAIAEHADVRRMLLTMKAQIEAGRALTYQAAIALDSAAAGDQMAQAKVDVLTPVVKAWCTDMAVEVTSIGVQIHGGMGYIEETGAAQFLRDARILPIYEGTNGIQALDLVFRKTMRDQGAAVKNYIEEMKGALPASYKDEFEKFFKSFEDTTDRLLKMEAGQAAAAGTPYLKAFGILAGGVLLALCADQTEDKKHLADFYTHNILPVAKAYLYAACEGSACI